MYRTTCNEYCGFGHHNMMGTVRVLYPGEMAVEASPDSPGSGEDAGAAAIGESVYTTNCTGCHQANGQGLPGTFPPLAGHAAELLEADRGYLPNVLLYGLAGEISVRGSVYNGQMPAWEQLSDEEIAGTLNYILSAWDESALPEDFETYMPKEIPPLRDEPLATADVHALRQTLDLND